MPTSPASSSSLRVRDDALALLKSAVLRRHGRLYGALMDEASRAIEEHARRLTESEGKPER